MVIHGTEAGKCGLYDSLQIQGVARFTPLLKVFTSSHETAVKRGDTPASGTDCTN